MHPTILAMKTIIANQDEAGLNSILAEDVTFRPPTYWATWTGREPVAAILGHVIDVFEDFEYRRMMGEGKDWALEFQCKIGELDCVGVDLITLNDEGLIQNFEVVMRPHKTVGVLRERMMASIKRDKRFLKYREMMMGQNTKTAPVKRRSLSNLFGLVG